MEGGFSARLERLINGHVEQCASLAIDPRTPEDIAECEESAWIDDAT
jgi:hypothetical protein